MMSGGGDGAVCLALQDRIFVPIRPAK